jgi:hypothetical protein
MNYEKKGGNKRDRDKERERERERENNKRADLCSGIAILL